MNHWRRSKERADIREARSTTEELILLLEHYGKSVMGPKMIADLIFSLHKLQSIKAQSVLAEPVPIVLFCPTCGKQHIDREDPNKGWYNPPHRTHLCTGCGFQWRPSDVPTTGVLTAKTHGVRDGTMPANAVPFKQAMPELRRAIERGLAAAQRQGNSEMVDVMQHLLNLYHERAVWLPMPWPWPHGRLEALKQLAEEYDGSPEGHALTAEQAVIDFVNGDEVRDLFIVCCTEP